MQFKLLVLISVLHCTAAEYFKTKPDFVKTCSKSDPEFDDCSKVAVQNLFNALGPVVQRPQLFEPLCNKNNIPTSWQFCGPGTWVSTGHKDTQLCDGLPEIDLPPLDPLKIPKIRILQGEGPVNINAALDDVTVTGFGKTEVLVSQVDGKTYDFYTKVRVPKIRIEGTYDLKGKILLIPLVGRGVCWFEPRNMTIDIVSEVKLYSKDDITFFNVTTAHVKYNIGGLRLRMNNLFDGIESLEESTNAYLNANWRPVSESLRPILSKTIEDILLDFMQQLFHNLPGHYLIGDLKQLPSKKHDTTTKH